jgi:transposase InsO family protein
MPSDFPRVRYILPKIGKANYNSLMKLISNSLTFGVSDAAKFRLHVLDHYYKYGWRSAVHAFGVKRSPVYNWRNAFEESGRKISSLIPKSTKPINTRQMRLDPVLIEFIKSMREEYGSLGKLKLKPFLDEYARNLNTATYGTTKIGVIIKRKHYFFENKSRKKVKRRKPLTPRIKYAPKETVPGYIEMDTVSIWAVGKKYYFITAIDIVTKYAWVKIVSTPLSIKAKEAFIEFRNSYKYPVRVVQTDNGSEFLKNFDKYLETLSIKHEFIYQKHPKINGVVERFNRTVQEEFIERNDEYMYDKEKFNQKLTNYLIWYNTKRPHYSLGQISPTEYMKRFE